MLGVHNGWLAVAPVLAAVTAAIAFCALATPRTRIGDVAPGRRRAARLGGGLGRRPQRGRGPDRRPWATAERRSPWWRWRAAASATTLLVLRYRERRAEPRAERLVAPGSPVGERIS